jgi:3-hydroxy-3-methylglutaryl CoA synthase
MAEAGAEAGAGILGFGAYVPRRRLQRQAIMAANGWFVPGLKGLARGERAIANWDEDSITMAVEAARDCLADADRCGIGAVVFASTTLPYADRLNAGIVKEALNLPDTVAAADAAGSRRAGITALLQCLRAAGGTAAPTLCLAADLRKARPGSEAEMVHGDAAAAMLVGVGQPIARLIGAHSVTVDFVDQFRETGQPFDYAWESRWIRDEGYMRLLGGALVDALARFAVAGAAIDRLLIPIAVRGVAEALAARAGIASAAVADPLSATVGDSGAAHPLLMLAAALEQARPGEKILVAGFGQGADILLFEVTEAIGASAPRLGVAGHIARRQPDSNYLRFLFHRGLVDLDRGMRAEADQKQPGTTLYRNRKTVLGLVGGRCTRTGTIQFPKTDISVNPNARAIGTQEDYPLAERPARIVTYTADALTYSPDPPQYYGTIDFEGGGRMFAEFTDVAAEDVAVGRAMRMVFRIRAADELRHFTKYFWKAVAAD